MKARYYHVDAFTGQLHAGNPAGVCLLDRWLPDACLQSVAMENGLSETAFVVWRKREFELRWFTPTMEVDLCGHATLATAHALARHEGVSLPIRFHTKSGLLEVVDNGGKLELNFPARPAEAVSIPADLVRGLKTTPLEVRKAPRDYLAVFSSEAEVRALAPDFAILAGLDRLGVIATAPGGDCDFVSRFFAPGAGIPEDPVTGSAHCTLIPYWAERLGKSSLHAKQVSLRGGELWCEVAGDRVKIAGEAVTYLEGLIVVGDA